jgi:hypothetical protein
MKSSDMLMIMQWTVSHDDDGYDDDEKKKKKF